MMAFAHPVAKDLWLYQNRQPQGACDNCSHCLAWIHQAALAIRAVVALFQMQHTSSHIGPRFVGQPQVQDKTQQPQESYADGPELLPPGCHPQRATRHTQSGPSGQQGVPAL